jgi:hypothetical protein
MSAGTYMTSLVVITDSPEEAVKVSELMNRLAVGMMMEGISARMDFTKYESEDGDLEAPTDENPGDPGRSATP